MGKSQKKIAAARRTTAEFTPEQAKENRELISKEGRRCDINDDKFAKVDDVYYRHKKFVGWQEYNTELYFAKLEKQRARDAKHLAHEQEYNALVAKGIIEVNTENLLIVMRYLNGQNLGFWKLPKMSIGYTAEQYDCDGKSGVTISLDEAIIYEDEMIQRFSFGTRSVHLNKYTRIG